MATIDLTQLSIADIVTSGKGKSAQFSYAGRPVYWQPCALPVAFEPGTYNGEPAPRVTMQFKAFAVQYTLNDLDKFIVCYAHLMAVKIWGKDMTMEEVQNMYHPCLKPSDKYEPTFKVKVNLQGPYRVNIWGVDKKLREAPASWKGLLVTSKLRLKCLWIKEASFGAIWEATDLMIEDQALECPF